LINKYGRERGERGLPKLLPGLNFIAGLNGETSATYDLNLKLLRGLKGEGAMLRRINIRQVEGDGFQEIDNNDFRAFKQTVRDDFDAPLLKEMLPLGSEIKQVWWEAHDGRTRLPRHLEPEARDPLINGKAGITFGRQIGAYPILVGMPYLTALESYSDVVVTGHGARSITAIDSKINLESASESKLKSIPGIGEKAAWRLVSQRAKRRAKGKDHPTTVEDWFKESELQISPIAQQVLFLNSEK
jgi:radical SAM superfamily enzyme with C-terminal helix-hairpin-helix motif